MSVFLTEDEKTLHKFYAEHIKEIGEDFDDFRAGVDQYPGNTVAERLEKYATHLKELKELTERMNRPDYAPPKKHGG